MAQVLDVDNIGNELVETPSKGVINCLVAIAISEMGDIDEPQRNWCRSFVAVILFLPLRIRWQEWILEAVRIPMQFGQRSDFSRTVIRFKSDAVPMQIGQRSGE